jgi:transposase-like protein
MDVTVPTRNSIVSAARKILMIKQIPYFIFHYSHTPLKKWFIVLYLFFVLWPGCSIMETSLQTDIPYYICYRFVRTVMETIASSSKSDIVKLKGVIETDEFYIKAGLKGRPYHDEILNSGRLPRNRGLKAWKGRGTFEKDTPMIICVHQRGEGITYFDVHDTKQSLISKIRRLIDCHHHTKVYTDEYLAYQNLKKYGFVHRQVCHSQREYTRGDVHVNNCECRSNLYQLWIAKFMGVNKHNLHTYTKTFEFIHNIRRKTSMRKKMFEHILIGS